MRLLTTGVSGQLGSEILKISDHENFGFYLKNKPELPRGVYLRCDITDRNEVLESISRIKPDWLLHLAAATKGVEWCETNKEAAWKVNVEGTRNIVDACRISDSKLIFISADFVFDGKRGNYKEEDPPMPINFYGKTKLEGEELVKQYPDHVIARSCLIYSGRGTFTSWVSEGLNRGYVGAAIDITASPVLASELASCLLFIVKNDLRGLYHTAGDEAISKYHFVRKFAEAYGYSPALVKPERQERLHLKAVRPKDSSLDISKIKSAGFRFSKIDEALQKLRKELEQQN